MQLVVKGNPVDTDDFIWSTLNVEFLNAIDIRQLPAAFIVTFAPCWEPISISEIHF
jgi:hypothetical protein